MSWGSECDYQCNHITVPSVPAERGLTFLNGLLHSLLLRGTCERNPMDV